MVEILHNKYQLPVYQIEDLENIQNVLNSIEFNEIYSFYSEQLPSNTRLSALPDFEKRLGFYLYYTGQDQFLNQISGILYSRHMPTIEEFLQKDEYMGNSYAIVYPYWRSILSKIFDPGNQIFECVFRGSIGCLSGNTKILSNNKIITIEDLAKIGENNVFDVISYDIEKNKFVKTKAFNARCTGKDRKVISVSLSDGTILECTSDHRFLLASCKYVEAKDLKKKDIICSNGDSITVKSVEFLNKRNSVYDIEVPGYHNFAVVTNSGKLIILHNSGKSTIARRGLLYTLYRICCLRNPHMLFKIAPDTVLSALMISVTKQHAEDTALKPMLEMIRNTPCFHEVRKVTAFDSFGPNDPVPYCKQGETIKFPNNVMLSIGSNINHIVGYSVFGCLTGDTEVVTDIGNIRIEDIAKSCKQYKVKTRELDGVFTWNNINHCECTKEVNELVEIELENGQIIRCTSDHKFPVEMVDSISKKNLIFYCGQWCKKAKDLKIFDNLIGCKIKNVRLNLLKQPVKVYNLEVDNILHNYLLSSGIVTCNSVFDEAEEKDSTEAFSLYTGLRERIRSRFLNSSLIYCALISSSKSKSGMVWEYIHKIKPNDPETLLLDPAIWEVKGEALALSGKKFWIYVGTKTHPSKVLPEEYNDVPLDKLNYVPPAGCDLMEVPIEYKREFENNIEAAIQNIAGRTTDTSDRPFDDLSLLGDCKNLIPEIHLEAPLGDPTPLIEKLPKDLFQMTTFGMKLARYPSAPRFCHVDLASQSSSQAGYSLWHKEYRINSVGEREIVFVADFISWITAPNRIDHDAIKKLSLDLRDKAGVYIKTISYDQYQCLAGDVEICILNGDSLTIKEIVNRFGEKGFNPKILTFNLKTKKYEDALISAVRESGKKRLALVYLSNGKIIRCSNDHRFLLDNGFYVHAYDLKPRDKLKNIPFKFRSVFIEKVIVTDRYEEMYDISIEPDKEPNFALTAGVFVHNSEYVRQSLQQNHEFENVKYQSVDRDITAYLNFAQWLISGRIKIGDCPYLREQLGHIGVFEKKITTTKKKDMADSCLSFDTKVFLLSGKVLTIEELYNSDISHEWILACDVENKKLIPVKIENVLQKHTPKFLYQITLSNGKTISLTEDHLILMRNGEYKRADKIGVSDELMPFNYYHELNYHDRYRKVVNPFNGVSKFLYKIVSKEFLSESIALAKKRAIEDGSKFTVIHHKSHNKNDDRPENLVPLTNIEHTSLHAMTGKEIKAFHDRTVFKRARSKIINEGLELMKKVNPNGYRKYLMEHDIADKLSEQKAKIENLRVFVTQINLVENNKPVYDIVLNTIHNFALDCNVFVHNCVGAVNNAYLDTTPVEFPFFEEKSQEVSLRKVLELDETKQNLIEI